MKQSKTIRRRRRLLSPPKTSAPSANLTDTKMNDRLDGAGRRAFPLRLERVQGKISKYNNNDENRR